MKKVDFTHIKGTREYKELQRIKNPDYKGDVRSTYIFDSNCPELFKLNYMESISTKKMSNFGILGLLKPSIKDFTVPEFFVKTRKNNLVTDQDIDNVNNYMNFVSKTQGFDVTFSCKRNGTDIITVIPVQNEFKGL